MDFSSTKLILLTGAWFTKNFDGFLGKELWAKVFNNRLIQNNEKLCSLLQDDYDFESVYSKIETDANLLSQDKNEFQVAVEHAYKQLDDAVRNWVFNSDNPTALDVYKLFGNRGFLESLFDFTPQLQSYIFTLNQDLLFERYLGHRAVGAPNGKFQKNIIASSF